MPLQDKREARGKEDGTWKWELGSELQTAKIRSQFIGHTCKRAFSGLENHFLRIVLILTSPREADCVTRYPVPTYRQVFSL